MDYRDRQVVVTGGTGALGTAVVGALIEAGAICHVPYLIEQEAARFPFRDHAQVKLVAGTDLADEGAVARLFDGVPRAVGVDPSGRRLRHGAGRQDHARPT